MPKIPVEHLSICTRCGKPYLNFCVTCAKALREEQVEELMEKHGLTLESLIVDLSTHLAQGNFGALRLAIEMRSMKPATKADVTSGGQPLNVDPHAQRRIAAKLSKILKSEPEE